MSLEPCDGRSIPVMTVRVARMMCPKGTLPMRIRDALGVVWSDEEFAGAFSSVGRPGASPGALALVSVLQSVEGLTDRQAAEAVRARVDWRYALGMELDDPGFDHSVLSRFRDRVIAGGVEADLLASLLRACTDRGLLSDARQVRMDSTRVLAATRMLSRLELLGETLRAVVERAVAVAPEWVDAWAGTERYERYARPVDSWNLPRSSAGRDALAAAIAADGQSLLGGVESGVPQAVVALPEFAMLGQVWAQQVVVVKGLAQLRAVEDLGPMEETITSPFDPQARRSYRRGDSWVGYKVHVVERCDDGAPQLVLVVDLAAATEPDVNSTNRLRRAVTAVLGDSLERVFADTGYVSAPTIVAAEADQVELVGPVSAGPGSRRDEGAPLGSDAFAVDVESEVAICPAGKRNIGWKTMRERGERTTEYARISFSVKDCRGCAFTRQCLTKVPQGQPRKRGRQLMHMLGDEGDALRRRRAEQHTEQWQRDYRKRSGVEGAISQGVRAVGMRRARYRGHDKVTFQHTVGACAINLIRIDAWKRGDRPESTRTTHLAQLKHQSPT